MSKSLIATLIYGAFVVAGMGFVIYSYFRERNKKRSANGDMALKTQSTNVHPLVAILAKPLMFIAWPFCVFITSPYIGKLILREFPFQFLGVYIFSGVAFSLLGEVKKWKDDNARKWLLRIYGVLLVAMLVNAYIFLMHGREDNFLLWGTDCSNVSRYGDPGNKYAATPKQLYDLPESKVLKDGKWRKLEGGVDTLFVVKVTGGDVVQIMDASGDWVIGLQAPDGEIFEIEYSAECDIEMPINSDGDLFFKLPAKSTLKYKLL